MLFSKKKREANVEKLLSICAELIDGYEQHETHPSCKSDLMLYVQNIVDISRQEIVRWKIPTTEYVTVANKLLAHGGFDLLTSGRYHIGAGHLNFMSCAPNLIDVYDKSMEYAVTNNIIDRKEKDEQYNYMVKLMKEIG